jgi:2-(1,2-epoxy-1,2-dihydrophenyl)acetyl-CoA isomerase
VAYRDIILKRENHIATLIMNRPERLNPVSDAMTDELAAAIAEVDRDEEVRVLILTGAGRAFSSGADFRYRQVSSGELTPETAEDFRPTLEGISRGHVLPTLAKGVLLALQWLGKPTIAMVNGDAVGLGLALACACDIRIGCPRARFGAGYPRIGLPVFSGVPWLLPRIIGLGHSLELIYTGDLYSAEEAYRMGLLNRLVPEESLEAETLAFASRLARGAPIGLRLSKMETAEIVRAI